MTTRKRSRSPSPSHISTSPAKRQKHVWDDLLIGMHELLMQKVNNQLFPLVMEFYLDDPGQTVWGFYWARDYKMLQWIINVLPAVLNKDNKVISMLFDTFCYTGDLKMAQWLHGRLRFTREQVRQFDNCLLRQVQSADQHDVEQWLIETFDLLKSDMQLDTTSDKTNLKSKRKRRSSSLQ